MPDQQTDPLSGQTAIVTGASSGIGEQIARAFAHDGADIVVAARREEKLISLAKELTDRFDVEVTPVRTDVRDESDVKEMVKTCIDEYGDLNIVANVAGIARGGDITETTTEEFRQTMESIVTGTFFTTRSSLPYLRESGGTLILMGSYAGTHPYPRNPVYGGARWWVSGFARSIERQDDADGVSVSVINPAEVRTQIWRDEYNKGEILEPETVAETVAFIARQDAPATISRLDLNHRNKFDGV